MDQGEEVPFASYSNLMNTLFPVDFVPLCEPNVLTQKVVRSMETIDI